jgi:hypothetical protein
LKANPGKDREIPISANKLAWWFVPIIPATQEIEVGIP